MSETRRIDVIVIGAGAAGAIIASELAIGGQKVVCLDKGQHYANDDFRMKFDEIKYYARGAIVPALTTDPITWRPDRRSDARLLPWATPRYWAFLQFTTVYSVAA
jgi:gluconate 2-dehydrogenase alpha chain